MKTKHPINKFQRKLIELKKNEKKTKDERPGRVWRKLSKEYEKVKETDDELRETIATV